MLGGGGETFFTIFVLQKNVFKDDLKRDYSIVRVGALYLVFEVAISPNNVIPCSVPRVLYRFIQATLKSRTSHETFLKDTIVIIYELKRKYC